MLMCVVSQGVGWWMESSTGVCGSYWPSQLPCSVPIWHACTICRERPNHASLEPRNLRWTRKV